MAFCFIINQLFQLLTKRQSKAIVHGFECGVKGAHIIIGFTLHPKNTSYRSLGTTEPTTQLENQSKGCSSVETTHLRVSLLLEVGNDGLANQLGCTHHVQHLQGGHTHTLTSATHLNH